MYTDTTSRLLPVAGMMLLLVFVVASPAWATTTSDQFPWTPVLQRIIDSMRGPVAHLLIMLAIVVSGFVFALVEMSYGMHRLMGVAFGGAIAIGVVAFMTAVGWAGAVV